MTLFISAVLIAAAFQSFCKLALLPRRWELLTALPLMPLPFFFEGRIARTSLVGIDTALSGAETLESWCALVVIQELFSLMAGFSLLAEHESGERVKRWKYVVFLPSALLPAGVFYLQMRLLNEFPNFEFRTITVWLAVLLPAAAAARPRSADSLRPARRMGSDPRRDFPAGRGECAADSRRRGRESFRLAVRIRAARRPGFSEYDFLYGLFNI